MQQLGNRAPLPKLDSSNDFLSAARNIMGDTSPTGDEEGTDHSPRQTRRTGFDSAKRHLDHFEKLRRNRPIFQRSGNVMGEDLLLLSAVDEADGYTAVGVELMHVLRFICVNLLAVRKLCRKHGKKCRLDMEMLWRLCSCRCLCFGE